MEKVQKDKQRSTKERHKTKDQVTRTPLKPGVNACAMNEQSRETFLDRGVLLTRKLLSQACSLVKMKSSLRIFYGHYHDLITVTEYVFVTEEMISS
jgi:hypothetical protein